MKNYVLRKPFFLTVSLISIFATFFRFILIKTNIDASTGFYLNTSSFSRIMLITLLVLALLLGIAALILYSKLPLLKERQSFSFEKFFDSRILFIALTVCFMFNTGFEIFRLINPPDDLVISNNMSFFGVVTLFLSIVCAVIFALLAFLPQNRHIASSGLLLAVVIFTAFRLMRDFTSYSTISFVSEHLLNIVYLCALLISFFSLCRCFSLCENKKGRRSVLVFAPITVVFGFTLSVSNIFGFILGFDSVSLSDLFRHLIDLPLAVFILKASMHLVKEN